MVELPVVRNTMLAAPVGVHTVTAAGSVGDHVGARRPGQAAQSHPLGASRVQPVDDGVGANRR